MFQVAIRKLCGLADGIRAARMRVCRDCPVTRLTLQSGSGCAWLALTGATPSRIARKNGSLLSAGE